MSVAYANLLDAMVAHIRGVPNVVAAFGDTGTANLATDKFWPSPVRKGVELPWAVYEDGSQGTQYTTGAASIESSVIRFLVVAAGKDAALTLARMLLKALNDAPLEFMEGRLMYFRASGPPTVQPVTEIAPDCPNAYAYGIAFDVMTQMTV